MTRVALLIGVGKYDTAAGLKDIPAAEKDVQAWQQILEDSSMGGFDTVTPLLHPTQAKMAETIETWFGRHTKEDLALLFISGHGIKDDENNLYFAASTTRKDRERLVRSTAVAANAVRDFMRQSQAKRQVVILDCCFSGAFGNLLAKDDGQIDLETALGAEGRVVMASSSSIQYSFESADGGLSIYTRYLLEGIRTGAADQDEDGAITVDELHQFASRKVQEAAPAMTPKIIVLKDEGFRIRIAKAPLGDPKVKYRKEVETLAQEDEGEIDPIINRPYLDEMQTSLGLSAADAEAIEFEVLEPFRQRDAKVARYRSVFEAAVKRRYPLTEKDQRNLKRLQQLLSLRDEDVEAIAIDLNIDLNPVGAIAAPPIHLTDHALPNSRPNPPKPAASPEPESEDDLQSEKGIDYTRLRDFLKAQDWKAADQETYEVMIRAVGKKSSNWFNLEELLNFPCVDLKAIDQLWVKHSQGRFGFSVQKQIYVECGGKLDGKYPDNEVWEQFGDRIGWRREGEWLSYSELNPSLSCPGIFPVFGFFCLGFGVLWIPGFFSLASRLVNCSTPQS